MNVSTGLAIRNAEAGDIPAVAKLLRAYMTEALDRSWEGSPEALIRDCLGTHMTTVLAVRDEVPIGFAFWHSVYNVHHCVAGGEITDFFVEKVWRHTGVPVRLVAAVARQIRESGGDFLRGRAGGSVERLYSRYTTVVPGAECYLAGDSFVALAEQEDAPARVLMGHLTSVLTEQKS